MKNLSEKIQEILDNWDNIEDKKGAILSALYVSDRPLTIEEMAMGIEMEKELFGKDASNWGLEQ